MGIVGYKKWLVFVAFLILSCNQFIPTPTPRTEIPPESETTSSTSEPTATPTPVPTTIPTPERYFLQFLSTCPPDYVEDEYGNCCPHNYIVDYDYTGYCIPPKDQTPPPTPRHGLWIAFVLPVLILGIFWLNLEVLITRYIQPIDIELSEVRVKTQDERFLDIGLSLNVRRSLTLASTRVTWDRIRDLASKRFEQELIYEALNYATIKELEQNLKYIADYYKNLPLVKELYDNFGVEVLQIDIKPKYLVLTGNPPRQSVSTAPASDTVEEYSVEEHIAFLKRQLAESHRYLNKLKERQATQGLETPASVLLQIEDYEEKISEIETKLAELSENTTPSQSSQTE